MHSFSPAEQKGPPGSISPVGRRCRAPPGQHASGRPSRLAISLPHHVTFDGQLGMGESLSHQPAERNNGRGRSDVVSVQLRLPGSSVHDSGSIKQRHAAAKIGTNRHCPRRRYCCCWQKLEAARDSFCPLGSLDRRQKMVDKPSTKRRKDSNASAMIQTRVVELRTGLACGLKSWRGGFLRDRLGEREKDNVPESRNVVGQR